MKGVVYLGDSEVEVREIAKPDPGPTEVVIEMKVGGLCGSDLHKYHSSRAWAQEREGMIAGHEPTGVVAELGRDVKNLSVGDRVCVYHSVGSIIFLSERNLFLKRHEIFFGVFRVTIIYFYTFWEQSGT